MPLQHHRQQRDDDHDADNDRHGIDGTTKALVLSQLDRHSSLGTQLLASRSPSSSPQPPSLPPVSFHPSIRLSVDHPLSNFSCATWIRLLSISKFLLKIKIQSPSLLRRRLESLLLSHTQNEEPLPLLVSIFSAHIH